MPIETKPVIEESHGTTTWRLNGQCHRTDGPAVESANGDTLWYVNGKLHRTNGPAVESNGSRYWFLNGLLHRTDGPAVQHAQEESWYVHGEFLVKITNDQVILSKRFAEKNGLMNKINKLIDPKNTFVDKAKSIFESLRFVLTR